MMSNVELSGQAQKSDLYVLNLQVSKRYPHSLQSKVLFCDSKLHFAPIVKMVKA